MFLRTGWSRLVVLVLALWVVGCLVVLYDAKQQLQHAVDYQESLSAPPLADGRPATVEEMMRLATDPDLPRRVQEDSDRFDYNLATAQRKSAEQNVNLILMVMILVPLALALLAFAVAWVVRGFSGGATELN
jgi:hypothetical protein